MQDLLTLSGQKLSRQAFGCMQFGQGTPEEDCPAVFEAVRAAGINHFDTAHVYTEGASEKILGGLIDEDRADLFVATKAGYTGGAGAQNLRHQCLESLNRLKTDYVDLMYIHLFDDGTDLAESFDALRTLQDEGKIRHIGVSNYSAWQTVKAQQVAVDCGTDIDAIQPMYSLIKRQAEVEILPMAQDLGLSVFSYSPLGGGYLSGKYSDENRPDTAGRLTNDARYAQRYGEDTMASTAGLLTDLATELKVAPATLAVAWVQQNPAITAPIISARTLTQLTPLLLAPDEGLGDDLYKAISALSITPPPATDRTETC